MICNFCFRNQRRNSEELIANNRSMSDMGFLDPMNYEKAVSLLPINQREEDNLDNDLDYPIEPNLNIYSELNSSSQINNHVKRTQAESRKLMMSEDSQEQSIRGLMKSQETYLNEKEESGEKNITHFPSLIR